MSVLNWAKPKQVMSRREYESISADGAPPGVYVPNMSDADAATWRAKKIGGDNPRIEIRVLRGSQAVIVVWPDDSVRISANGPIELDGQGWIDLVAAVTEARVALSMGKNP